MVLESSGELMNHRDASNTGVVWKHAPTRISIPGSNERPRHRRPQDNPYFRGLNNLSSHKPPGNPNVRQTVLAKPPDRSSFGTDSRAQKRLKLDFEVSSSRTSNGVSSSHLRGPASRTNISEPDIQVIEQPQSTNKRSKPVSNDAEVIDLGTSSDDLGELIPRAPKSSSPCPLLLQSAPTIHAFETLPTEYSSSASHKGKGRATEPPEVVEGSEEEEDISDFTSPSTVGRPSVKVKVIPPDIVADRRKLFEGVSAAVTIRPIQKGVKSVDLTTGSVIKRMKRKGESALDHKISTTSIDPVGMSSSNLSNSKRGKRDTDTVLPLTAWCFGLHLFEPSGSTPLKLTYHAPRHRISVTVGGSPPEKIVFQLDRDVSQMMVVNHPDEPLKENVVIQFTTVEGSPWDGFERKYKGFRAGGNRKMGEITFLFSTSQDQGFTLTDYQTFVAKTRKVVPSNAVETMSPDKGATIWKFATQHAAMFQQTQSRSKEDRKEDVLYEPSALARSSTPCSSTSVNAGPELKSQNGDPGPSISYRRSARQSAIRALRASPSPPLLPAQLEQDEVVLMYPPTGTGALSIMSSDLKRLKPEEYLNDTLIEFGLKLWLNDLRDKDPLLADQIHVFSSFFYKKLNNRKNLEDGYQSVRKWTSKFDIFTKKYIIVPINENVHWYLAIIYEPGHTLEPPLPVLQHSSTRTTRRRKQNGGTKDHPDTLREGSLELLGPLPKATEAEASSMDATRATTPSTRDDGSESVTIIAFDKSCSITAGSKPVSATSSDIQMRDSSPNLVHPPSDSMDIDADVSATDAVPNLTSEPPASKPSSGIPSNHFYGHVPNGRDVEPVVIEDNDDSGEDQRQEAEVDDMLAVTRSASGYLPSQTYIFTLDSLGTRHPQAIKVLKNYLKWEAKDKHNFDEVRDAVGKHVQVPVQPNTWDCGIYLLHFVKTFITAPSDFVGQILATKGTMPSSDRKKMWQDQEIPHFRDYLSSRISQLSEEWKADNLQRVGEEANKRKIADAQDAETLSSEGEVDIVEDLSSAKAPPGPKQKQLATRLRG